jgi:hypothetical protein
MVWEKIWNKRVIVNTSNHTSFFACLNKEAGKRLPTVPSDEFQA